jgi:hypothetical protein
MGGPLYVHLSDSAICYEMGTRVLHYKKHFIIQEFQEN